MKLLSRIAMVFALLGVLAYGSYAFGMYVLSAKLFGDNISSKTQRNISRSTTEASAVTRQTGWKGSKPRVEVKVLPADASDASAPLPAYADEDGFQKSAPREKRRDADSDSDSDNAAPQARLGKREFDSGSPEYSLDDEKKSSKRSSRRRRRSRSKSEDKKPDPKPDDAQVSSSPTPAGEGRSDSDDSNRSRDNSSSSSNDNSSSGSDRAIIKDSSSRERETPRETSKPRESSRRRNSSTRTRSRDSSPVPRPEGSRSSGGDSASSSPVPQPE